MSLQRGASKEEAKLHAQQERAAKEAEEIRKARFTSIETRPRRSKVWCSCGLPVHADKCRLWSGSHQLRWPGADKYVSQAGLDWFLGESWETSPTHQTLVNKGCIASVEGWAQGSLKLGSGMEGIHP